MEFLIQSFLTVDGITWLKYLSQNLLKSLEIMWKGLVAIIIVIALVILVTVLVNKACVAMDKKAQAKKDEQSTSDGSGQN